MGEGKKEGPRIAEKQAGLESPRSRGIARATGSTKEQAIERGPLRSESLCSSALTWNQRIITELPVVMIARTLGPGAGLPLGQISKPL